MSVEEHKYQQAMLQYEKTKKELEEAISFYDDLRKDQRDEMGITEVDYIRLRQLLQIAEKYLPKTSIAPIELTDKTRKLFLFSKLLDKYRSSSFFARTKKQEEKKENKLSVNYYLLAEKFFSDFRDVRHANFALKRVKISTEKTVDLDIEPSGELLRERREGPGITDDYRQGSWGIERICLDGMQNHLPNDSKGTRCWLHFLVDGKWVEREEALLHRDRIAKVRFSDDGVGFTPDNLLYLHSTKTSEQDSAGQFGEGMKLASMASFRLGLGMEFQSRNWSAMVLGEPITMVNTRDNDNIEKLNKLIYDIKEFSGDPIIGSRTIFHTPTREFIDYALTLPEKVLPLNPNYRPVFTTERGDIVSTTDGGKLFVKGIYVQDIDSFFSYNFDAAGVNPDRNQVVNFNIEDNICSILFHLSEKNIIKTLIANVQKFYNDDHFSDEVGSIKELSSVLRGRYPGAYPIETTLAWRSSNGFTYNPPGGCPSLWRQAFEELFENKQIVNEEGQKKQAVLRTRFDVPESLKEKLNEYTIIELYYEWYKFLASAGVKIDSAILPEFYTTIITTSLSLKYGEGMWDDERLMLDAAQNHLPSDSGGTHIMVKFKTKDGKWHAYNELSAFCDDEIEKIKISDNGRGYDSKSLGLLASVKDHSDSTGKFGEGLKMLSTVALRKGYKVEFRSRNWFAVPMAKKDVLNEGKSNEEEIEQLLFEVHTKTDKSSSFKDDDPNNINESSSTTFVDPPANLVQMFRTLSDKILALQERNCICCDDNGKTFLLDFNSRRIFVRDILIPEVHFTKYSYHFKGLDIKSRDRNSIDYESLKREVCSFLHSTDSPRFISKFLADAVEVAKNPEEKGLEFETKFTSISPDLWIETFKQDFGVDTAIRKSSDQDMNAIHRAQHLGLKVVTLPDSVFDSLHAMRGKNGEQITSYEKELSNSVANSREIPSDELTDYEKFMIEHLLKFNKILEASDDKRPIKNIVIYSYPSDYMGTRADGYADFGDTVHIERNVLNGELVHLADVFIHEAGHAKTGAEDADSKFRNYFTRKLAQLALQIIPVGDKPVITAGIGEHVSASDLLDMEEIEVLSPEKSSVLN